MMTGTPHVRVTAMTQPREFSIAQPVERAVMRLLRVCDTCVTCRVYNQRHMPIVIALPLTGRLPSLDRILRNMTRRVSP